MKNLVRLLAVLTLVSILLAGCFGTGTTEFTCEELTITVPSYMSDESDDSAFADFTFALDSYKIAIFGIKEEFSMFEGTVVEDLESYIDVVIQGNELDCDAQTREGKDYLYFTYEAENGDTTYGYICAAYKANDAYWLVQVAAEKSNFDEAEYLEILDSVVFQ